MVTVLYLFKLIFIPIRGVEGIMVTVLYLFELIFIVKKSLVGRWLYLRPRMQDQKEYDVGTNLFSRFQRQVKIFTYVHVHTQTSFGRRSHGAVILSRSEGDLLSYCPLVSEAFELEYHSIQSAKETYPLTTSSPPSPPVPADTKTNPPACPNG